MEQPYVLLTNEYLQGPMYNMHNLEFLSHFFIQVTLQAHCGCTLYSHVPQVVQRQCADHAQMLPPRLLVRTCLTHHRCRDTMTWHMRSTHALQG